MTPVEFQLGSLQQSLCLPICIHVGAQRSALRFVDLGTKQGLAAGGGGGVLRFHAASI